VISIGSLSGGGGQTSHLEFKGLLRFFRLINDFNLLSKLDEWRIYYLKLVLRKHQKLWINKKACTLPRPSVDWIDKITDLTFWKREIGKRCDLRIPSFYLINKIQQKETTNLKRFFLLKNYLSISILSQVHNLNTKTGDKKNGISE
jgi:hypothetical protein